jgi:hypothetical protein
VNNTTIQATASSGHARKDQKTYEQQNVLNGLNSWNVGDTTTGLTCTDMRLVPGIRIDFLLTLTCQVGCKKASNPAENERSPHGRKRITDVMGR